jgi:hypothetical protein
MNDTPNLSNKTNAERINVRLFDLVRYMRSELHAENLITDDEYTWLCLKEFPNDPKTGSPSPRRLEDYDQLRAYVSALEDRMDSHGLQAAQRAAGMAKAQPEIST